MIKRLAAAWHDLCGARLMRRHGCKLSGGVRQLGRDSQLLLEPQVSIGGAVVIKCDKLEIGAYSYLRSGCELYAVSSIGRFCSIGNNVIIGLDRHEHPMDWLSTSLYNSVLTEKYRQANSSARSDVTIGHDCWIGRDACIMNGVHIGNGAIVAARSVVTSDVPAYAVVAGIPARVVRYRFPDDWITRLEVICWWDFPVDVLDRLDFSKPLDCLQRLEHGPADAARRYPKLSINRCGVHLIS
ncbi:MAG: acetyltransferase [Betaproteobacteria bacterium HGW-Betaproteobacteria-1]|jgi:acetyltransferase-like isoleucine patch superfamily enzyme|nr:MAG: acetyltransferase [Betaproteobacteria bacterium HGW-Betaproteobacteria-1]